MGIWPSLMSHRLTMEKNRIKTKTRLANRCYYTFIANNLTNALIELENYYLGLTQRVESDWNY